ncbi:MAG TPA: hypothetical protein VNX66_03955 [Candidatus Sulfotelmatobacter sp.]|jgi:hypothetical protein|nr:hypothetical protein [Candidatus Sulfotelmatobacter sp.]
MWIAIAKGVGLGLVLFAAFVVFRYAMFIGPPRPGVAVSLNAVYALTVGSYIFWLALFCCVGLGICVIDSIPIRVQP